MTNNKEVTKVDFTDVIIEKFTKVAGQNGLVIRPEELTSFKYFIGENLSKVLGNTEVDLNDVEFIDRSKRFSRKQIEKNYETRKEEYDGVDFVIELANQFTSPNTLSINIGTEWYTDEVKHKHPEELSYTSEDGVVYGFNQESKSHAHPSLCAYLGDEIVFVTQCSKKKINNEVSYYKDSSNIIEKSEINFKGNQEDYDANRFYFFKSVNGAKEYDGSLTSVFSRGIDGFDFHYGDDENEEHASFIQWIIQLMATNQYVNIGIADKRGKLVDFTGHIFIALQQKLNESKAKIDNKALELKRIKEDK